MMPVVVLQKPPVPKEREITHHSVELEWEEALDEANLQMEVYKGDSRVHVLVQQQVPNQSSWTPIHNGYGTFFIQEKLEPATTYTFRIQFSTGTNTSEWSDEVNVKTLSMPMTGDNIFKAIKAQDTAALRRLLNTNGPKVDTEDRYSFSPLMYCAYHGHLDLMEILFEYGADPNFANSVGKTPLMMATLAGRLNVVKELRQRGASYDLCDKAGSTALHCAMSCMNLELVDWMINDGADVTAKDLNGWTPLLRLAAIGGMEDIIDLLVKHEADVNVKDSNDKTALMIATTYGNKEFVQRLLEHKADITIMNEYGKTAFDMAVALEKKAVVKCMIDWMDLHEIHHWLRERKRHSILSTAK